MSLTVGVGVTVGTSGPWPGKLRIERETIEIRSERESRPDMRWVFLDRAGHWHAFDKDGNTPTLRRYMMPVPCDGSCGGVCQGEGYHVSRWACLGCAAPVRPRFTTAYDVRSAIPGAMHWEVQVEVPGSRWEPIPPYPGKVSVVAQVERRLWFGFAVGGDFTYSTTTVEVLLVGASALGERAQ